ncbi:GT2 family glycosyltransferase [Streptomyces ambofaciens]
MDGVELEENLGVSGGRNVAVEHLRACGDVDVVVDLGGGHGLSMRMLDRIGGWPDKFFFAHEETDLAWRALDDGWRVVYEPSLLLQHPWTSPARHAVYYRMTARNRVWLAKRHLPAPLVPAYLGVWALLTVVRTRSWDGWRAWVARRSSRRRATQRPGTIRSTCLRRRFDRTRHAAHGRPRRPLRERAVVWERRAVG